MEERGKPKRTGLYWREEGDADLVVPILLAFMGFTILSWTGTLLWWVAISPPEPFDWGLWFWIIVGLITGIWWTQSGIRQLHALWRGRRRLTGIERRYYIWRVGAVFILIALSFGLLMVVVPDFVRPLFLPTIALALASAVCFLAGRLAGSEN